MIAWWRARLVKKSNQVENGITRAIFREQLAVYPEKEDGSLVTGRE